MNETPFDWAHIPAAVWRRHRSGLRAIRRLDPIIWDDLTGIDRQKQSLARNTERFLAGEPSNNALRWCARGTGKSSLVKALLNRYRDQGLRMIEVDKDDLVNLPEIVDDICDLHFRFVIFCDDLSFDVGESGYKALKSVLEGSLELPPENVRVYATSNRRHLMPEFMSDNLKSEVRDGRSHRRAGLAGRPVWPAAVVLSLLPGYLPAGGGCLVPASGRPGTAAYRSGALCHRQGCAQRPHRPAVFPPVCRRPPVHLRPAIAGEPS